MSNLKRKRQIKTRVNDEEFAIILEKSKLTNLSINKYLKKIAVDGEIYVQDLKSIHDLIFEINKIGQNINQIAKWANGHGGVNPSDVNYLKRQVESIWQLLKLKILKPTYQEH